MTMLMRNSNLDSECRSMVLMASHEIEGVVPTAFSLEGSSFETDLLLFG